MRNELYIHVELFCLLSASLPSHSPFADLSHTTLTFACPPHPLPHSLIVQKFRCLTKICILCVFSLLSWCTRQSCHCYCCCCTRVVRATELIICMVRQSQCMSFRFYSIKFECISIRNGYEANKFCTIIIIIVLKFI